MKFSFRNFVLSLLRKPFQVTFLGRIFTKKAFTRKSTTAIKIWTRSCAIYLLFVLWRKNFTCRRVDAFLGSDENKFHSDENSHLAAIKRTFECSWHFKIEIPTVWEIKKIFARHRPAASLQRWNDEVKKDCQDLNRLNTKNWGSNTIWRNNSLCSRQRSLFTLNIIKFASFSFFIINADLLHFWVQVICISLKVGKVHQFW